MSQQLDLNMAIANALTFMGGIAGNLGEFKPEEIMLEEIESEDSGENWLITFSFPHKMTGTVFDFANIGRRTYKVFKVKKSDYEVVSMKIRD